MKLVITTDDGETLRLDTANLALSEGTERTKLLDALVDTMHRLTDDPFAISSIRADISAVIGRIEHELGAHPAFTWAQTKLSNAAAHLEAYAAGTWTEPAFVHGLVVDARGAVVSIEHGARLALAASVTEALHVASNLGGTVVVNQDGKVSLNGNLNLRATEATE